MTVQEAVIKRYSERIMDPEKKISEEDIKTILTAGIKAPCGYGSEPWKFLVVDGNRTKLLDCTHNQAAVADSSHLVVLLYNKIRGIQLDDSYYTSKMLNKGVPLVKVERNKMILYELARGNYMREQCLFAASQMVLQATGLGIDSLIMGGMDPDSLAKRLNVDLSVYGIAVIVAFGYRKNNVVKKRTTKDFNDVVEFITLK